VRNRFKMSQQKDEKKRARTPNFSPDEKVALLNLIKKKECVVKTHDRSETFVLQENQNIVNYH
jgi:hypothetical protein